MKLSQRILSGIAVAALIVTAAATGLPAMPASAGPLPDVTLKYDGYLWGGPNELDVAYSVTSKYAAANMNIDAVCQFRSKVSPNNTTGQQKSTIGLGLPQPQAVPVPKLVVCNPPSGQYVSSVIIHANVGSDANESDNTVVWDAVTKIPHPDVHVGYGTRQKLANGQVNALFALTDTQADAPDVVLHSTCNYRTTAAPHNPTPADEKLETVSLKKNQNAGAKWVNCAPRAGQYVSSVFLTAEVQKPFMDDNQSNNTAYWDLASMG